MICELLSQRKLFTETAKFSVYHGYLTDRKSQKVQEQNFVKFTKIRQNEDVVQKIIPIQNVYYY